MNHLQKEIKEEPRNDIDLASEMEPSMTSDKCTKFWQQLEQKSSIKLPEYLKYILSKTGFDNATSLKTLTEDDIKEIEELVNSSSILKDLKTRSRYFRDILDGLRFTFPIGHKRLLRLLIDYVHNESRPLNCSAIDNSNSAKLKEINADFEKMTLIALIRKGIAQDLKFKLSLARAKHLSNLEINLIICHAPNAKYYKSNLKCIFCQQIVTVYKLEGNWIASAYFWHIFTYHKIVRRNVSM